MYARQQFREERREVLVAAIRDIRFAALTAVDGADVEAVHVPVVIREAAAGLVLEAHVSAANPFWRTAAAGPRGLAIFQGPHAYVHPGWLETERTTGRTVPTWSYVAVHARGALSVQKDRDWLLAHLEELAALNEQPREPPWTISSTPEGYIEGLLDGIVGLGLEIDGFEGAWKMLQHHPDANRRGVIAGLSESGRLEDQAMAAVMQEHEDSLRRKSHARKMVEPTRGDDQSV